MKCHSGMSDSLRPHGLRLPDSSVHGISQTRILEWVAIPFSRGYPWPRSQTWAPCFAGRFFPIWASRILCSNLRKMATLLSKKVVDVPCSSSPLDERERSSYSSSLCSNFFSLQSGDYPRLTLPIFDVCSLGLGKKWPTVVLKSILPKNTVL